MSKKKDEDKNEKINDEIINKPKTTSNQELKTLLDFVNESNLRRKTLISLLSREGYLSQFYEEETKMKKGIYVEPTISEQEFKKIIGE